MLRLVAVTATAALLLAALVAQVGDAKEKSAKKKKEAGVKRPVGTWTRSDGDRSVSFKINKANLRCTLTEGDKSLVVDADYGVSRDGVLFGRISKVEKKGVEGGPEEGMLFSFHFSRKGDTLTISNLQAPTGDEARQVIEGDYKGGPHRKKKG
jgi:hypothetical protein